MARRRHRPETVEALDDARDRRHRFAAQFAFCMAGGMPADWVDDRFWSRWNDDMREAWGDREAVTALYMSGLEHLGDGALRLYDHQLERLERSAITRNERTRR